MSSTLIESPISTSQMYFSWCEADSQATVEVPAPARQRQTRLPSRARRSQSARPVGSLPAAAPSPCPEGEAPRSPASDRLEFTAEGKIARPVKIGSVMIKLLKQYGITDDEIAAGLASYAHKHRTAAAS